ncbi:MAG: hypothetical protein L6R19_10265, partial [Alphaproteobacteria bacterium]|nr:hypothetical protein [Alphaproteobacteria bacterium]
MVVLLSVRSTCAMHRAMPVRRRSRFGKSERRARRIPAAGGIPPAPLAAVDPAANPNDWRADHRAPAP